MSNVQQFFAEQLHQHQHQQRLEQQGGSFQLSPLSEPFLPNNSPVVTSPPVSLATHNPGRQGRVPLKHNQASPVQAEQLQLHTTIQNLPVSKMQGSPVHGLLGGERFRASWQLQPNIRGVVNQRPAPQVQSCPAYHGTQRMPPSPPSLPISHCNLQPNYHANLPFIRFQDKASCKQAGEGELEVQKTKLLSQCLMLAESAAQQLQPELLPPLPHSTKVKTNMEGDCHSQSIDHVQLLMAVGRG